MNDQIILDNFDTLRPDMVAIEVLKFQDANSDEYTYTAQLIIVVDKVLQRMFYLPIDIWEDTPYEACRKALQGAMRLFDEIGNDVPVIDVKTGKMLDKIELNATFPSWRDIDEADVSKAPEGVVLH